MKGCLVVQMGMNMLDRNIERAGDIRPNPVKCRQVGSSRDAAELGNG
jgi:phage FluMu protein gp41